MIDKSSCKKIQQIIDLLKFVRTIDDKDIVNATIDSVIESLEEEIK